MLVRVENIRLSQRECKALIGATNYCYDRFVNSGDMTMTQLDRLQAKLEKVHDKLKRK